MDYQNNEPVRSGDYGTGSEQAAVPAKEKKGFAVAALVLGIISILGLCCCGLGGLTAPFAIIFGIVALVKKQAGTGMYVTGIVLAVLTLIMVGSMLYVVSDFMPYSQEIATDYMQLVNDQDEVFPAYEEDGTLPAYMEKYKESPYKELLDKYGVTIEAFMDQLLVQYKTGQLKKYEFSMPDSSTIDKPDDTEDYDIEDFDTEDSIQQPIL